MGHQLPWTPSWAGISASISCSSAQLDFLSHRTHTDFSVGCTMLGDRDVFMQQLTGSMRYEPNMWS